LTHTRNVGGRRKLLANDESTSFFHLRDSGAIFSLLKLIPVRSYSGSLP